MTVPTGVEAAAHAARLEHLLHPWSSFVVIPIFALANAGVALSLDGSLSPSGADGSWLLHAGDAYFFRGEVDPVSAFDGRHRVPLRVVIDVTIQ